MRRFLWPMLALFVSCCSTAPVTAAPLDTGGRMVAISLDDGPWSPGDRTGKLLDVLRDEGVVATFCLVGEMVDIPYGRSMVQRMHHEGHELCNHTYTHPILTQGNIARQIASTDAAIGRALGVDNYKTVILRAPQGNTKYLRDKQCYGGRPFVGWGSHGDSDDYRFSGAHVLQVANRLPAGEILLLHDMHETPERLREIIHELKVRGMTFVHASALWVNPCGSHMANN